MEEKVRINFEVESSTRVLWRSEALVRGLPLSDLLRQAMDGYLAQNSIEQAPASEPLRWLEQNADHVHFVRSQTGNNFRMYSSRNGVQVTAPTLKECIEKMQRMQ